MTMRHVRLELARSPGFPEGSIHHGYEFNLPLTADGHIDLDAWGKAKKDCTVRRFWQGQADEHGHLTRHGKGWAFSYDPTTTDDDEPLFRFESHPFKAGEYVSITEHDGVQRPFKVVYVR
ncbi:MAG: hypothetical protein AB7G39_07955 [Alphaproteobacteria bacterium]